MKLLSEEEIHKLWLLIDDPFIPRYLDVGRRTAEAQAKLTHQEDVKWLESQFYGGQGRQRIFYIDCDDLDAWKNE